jgi:hypothetical protein
LATANQDQDVAFLDAIGPVLFSRDSLALGEDPGRADLR